MHTTFHFVAPTAYINQVRTTIDEWIGSSAVSVRSFLLSKYLKRTFAPHFVQIYVIHSTKRFLRKIKVIKCQIARFRIQLEIRQVLCCIHVVCVSFRTGSI